MVADYTLSGHIKKYIRAVFDEREVPEELREGLWKQYFQKFSSAVDKALPEGFEFSDKDLVKKLKNNLAEFSAFKEESFNKNLKKLLFKDGHLESWNDFQLNAYSIDSDYNSLWRETEYHQTIANVNMACRYEDFQRAKELYPNLKIVVINDQRTRPDHKILDGIIKPVDDPYWKTHLPPFDWGCRCGVEQTDEEPTSETPNLELKDEFKNNSALTGKVFGESAYEKDLTEEERKKALKNLKKFQKSK